MKYKRERGGWDHDDGNEKGEGTKIALCKDVKIK
jgi:hypothetical protein